MWEVIIGALIGGGLSIYATHLSNKSNAKIQKELSILKRDLLADEFQKQSLVEVQEILISILRLEAKAYLDNKKSYRLSNKWDFLYDSEDDEKLGELGRRLTILIERIRNEDLRSQLKEFKKTTALLFVSESEEEAFLVSKDMGDRYHNLNELIGTELLKL